MAEVKSDMYVCPFLPSISVVPLGIIGRRGLIFTRATVVLARERHIATFRCSYMPAHTTHASKLVGCTDALMRCFCWAVGTLSLLALVFRSLVDRPMIHANVKHSPWISLLLLQEDAFRAANIWRYEKLNKIRIGTGILNMIPYSPP